MHNINISNGTLVTYSVSQVRMGGADWLPSSDPCTLLPPIPYRVFIGDKQGGNKPLVASN